MKLGDLVRGSMQWALISNYVRAHGVCMRMLWYCEWWCRRHASPEIGAHAAVHATLQKTACAGVVPRVTRRVQHVWIWWVWS